MDRKERNKASKKNPEGTRTKQAAASTEAKPASAMPQRKGRQGRRFTQAQKKHALLLIASGMKRTEVAEGIGTTCESLRRWMVAAKADGIMPTPPESADRTSAADAESGAGETPGSSGSVPRSPYAPRDPGQGLASHEVAAILELKKTHPAMGPAQLRAQLKRFRGWRIARKAIARVLRDNGYELVHKGSRPQGPEPQRFEAPRRNALWQLDFAEFRIAGERLHLLVILDDFSRYVPAHALADGPTSEVAREILQLAIARHGKPEAVRTDRGGAFVASSKQSDFGQFLEAELIDHHVGRPYHPQGGGKVEALIATVRRELWDVEQFANRAEAERRLAAFIDEYNHARAHLGIDGLTPADRYFGRADQVLARIDALSRHRQGASAAIAGPGAPIEEIGSQATGAPLEVLRLVIQDDQMELTLCGARVRLGPLEM
jgi:transposase InsO family protein